MKKLLLIGVLALATLRANAIATWKTPSFINNGTYLVFTNYNVATALTYGFTNNNSGTNLWYYSYSAATNIISGYTNAAGTTLPAAIVDVDIEADQNADINPNLAITITSGVYSNYPAPSLQSPVVLNSVWTNPAAYIVPTTGSGTNVAQFTFAPVTSEGYVDATRQFQFTYNPSVQATVAGSASMTTNLPTAFLQGCRKIRLLSVIVSTNKTVIQDGLIVNAIKLQGWFP